VLGRVGAQYQPIRNWMGGDIMNAIVSGDLGIKGTIENVGQLHDGARVFVQVKIGDTWNIKGDGMNDLLTFTNTHDGSLKCSIGTTSIRIVCENTHLYATREAGSTGTSVKHTRNAVAKVEKFAEELKILCKLMATYRAACERFAETRISVDQSKTLLLDMLGHGGKLLTEAPPQTRTTVEDILTRAESGIGNKQFAGTCWALYNGVTEHADHGGMRTRVPEGGDREGLLLNSRLYGSGKTLKDDAFNSLRKFAGA